MITRIINYRNAHGTPPPAPRKPDGYPNLTHEKRNKRWTSTCNEIGNVPSGNV